MKKIIITKLITSLVVCLLAGFLGSIFTMLTIDNWYIYLNKPGFTPPNWLFSPVWTALYLMMGFALFIVWKGQKGDKKTAISLFSLQLLLNIFWSIIFFGLKLPGLAFIEIIFLWLAILWTIVKFYKISKPAAYLLTPYILWVTFAAFLNYSIWLLNLSF